MNILGISAFYHDSAAALVCGGEICAAAQEERFSRIKHDPSFPIHAAQYCLQEKNFTPDDLDCVVFYEKPFLKFERLLLTYLSVAPKGFRSFLNQMPAWLKEKLFTRNLIRNYLQYKGPVLFVTHHQAHAAAAFYPSPFEEAAILTLDGVGEWATTSLGYGKGNHITLIRQINFPHSLGLMYSAFTYFTGFKVNSGEYKLMGLAPYGEPKFAPLIREKLIHIKEDGSYRLNLKYFDFCGGQRMVNKAFEELFGGPPRKPEDPITEREMDIARSIQEVTEEIVLRLAYTAYNLTKLNKIVLSGGVALNCVANGRLLREGPFEEVWVQPAASDAGSALGAALFIWHQMYDKERVPDKFRQKGSFLGPAFSDETIQSYLDMHGIPYVSLSEEELCRRVAELIAEGKVVGWFQGRMEFGPRALGARSILADPRSAQMQSLLNLKIKFRESFRPFAPAVLLEKTREYFDLPSESPYMLFTAPVHPNQLRKLTDQEKNARGLDKLRVIRSTIPAVTHVDNSARIQTVDERSNPRFYRLLKCFYELTGCPVLINTSFNVRGEPIVCTPHEAYVCFMRTDMDFLAIGTFLLDKKQQPIWREDENWKAIFTMD